MADPMKWMGKPVSPDVRNIAYHVACEIGLDPVKAHAVIEKMSNALERDEPYQAQSAAMMYVDLTAYYRLMAVILSNVMKENT